MDQTAFSLALQELEPGSLYTPDLLRGFERHLNLELAETLGLALNIIFCEAPIEPYACLQL